MNKVIYSAIIILSLIGCLGKSSQNPKYLGEDYSLFNLTDVAFEENIDTLFSKVKYLKLVEEDEKKDKKTGEYTIADTIAFVYKVRKRKIQIIFTCTGIYLFKKTALYVLKRQKRVSSG